jgi:hypothetical protein
MALFHVAVLVGLAGLNRLPLQPVMPQQRLVTLVEAGPFRPRRHGGGQPVGTMDLGHTTQLEQGVLQTFAQALQALGKTDGARLPVAVGQHEVVDHVVQRRAVDGHPQVGAVGEVTGTQPAGVVHLGEEHLLGLAVQGSPPLDPPLQRPELVVGEPPRVTALQIDKQGLGFQARVEQQQLLELGPDFSEGIRSGAVIPVHELDLTGQSVEASVLAGGLGIESRLGRDLLLGQMLKIEPSELANLLIGDHREHP